MRKGVLIIRRIYQRKWRAWLALLLMITLAACNLPQQGGIKLVQPTGDAAPRAWVDAPLEGMVLPLSSYDVVFHGASLAGVERGELSVNDAMVAASENVEPGATLAVFRIPWRPAAAGKYVLKVRAMDMTGRWSDPSSVTVKVGGTPSPTPTATVTATLTLTHSLTPTVSATPTRSPTPTQTLTPTITLTPSATQKGEHSFSPQVAPDVFYSSGCTPDRLEIAVQVAPYGDFTNLFVFYQLEDQEKGSSTGWGDALAMGKPSPGHFSYTLLSARVNGAGLYTNATLLLQFVALDADGNVVARSSVYAAATLTRCGSRPPAGMLPLRPGITLIPHLVPTTPVPIVK
jgi:hypothetical protein